MNKEKKIIEKASTKYGGILVDGKWYSTSERVKPYVKKELEGSEVELTTTPGEKGEIVTFMKPTGAVQSQPQAQGQKQYTRAEPSEYDKQKDSRMMRHGLINSAIEFLKMNQAPGEGSSKVTLSEVIQTAEAMKKYVENGTVPEQNGNIEEEEDVE